MKKSTLITGVSGSGKSTLIKKLNELGYTAHDIENVLDLYTASEKQTGKVLQEWDNTNLAQIKDLVWTCDKEKLASLIAGEPSELAFYGGAASNVEEIMPLFNKVILLKADSKTIKHRLTTRTTHDFARTSAVQDWILSWKDEWETDLQKKGAIVINANGYADETVRKVIEGIQ